MFKCKCGNPAKVEDMCWYCYYKRDNRLKLYFMKFGKDGCIDEKIPNFRILLEKGE